MASYFVERSAKNLGVVANPAEPVVGVALNGTASHWSLLSAGVMRVGTPMGVGIAPPSDGICAGAEESAGAEGVAVTTTGGRRGSSDAAARRQG